MVVRKKVAQREGVALWADEVQHIELGCKELGRAQHCYGSISDTKYHDVTATVPANLPHNVPFARCARCTGRLVLDGISALSKCGPTNDQS
jgi:hypothetical protein